MPRTNETGLLNDGLDIAVAVKPPPKCEGKTEKECDEAGTAWVLGTTCAMAAIAMGAPELAPLCGTLAASVAKYAAPIFRWTGTAMQDAVLAVLPGSLKAQGVFSPNIAALEMWIANPNCFDPSCGITPPILAAWQAAQHAVQVCWDEGRKAAGLAPAPLRVRPEILFPGSEAGILGIPAPDFVEGAEECLYWWLYRYDKGWSVISTIGPFGETDGRVNHSEIPGVVEDMPTLVAGGDPDTWIGKGPFGLWAGTWPRKCTDFCHRSFHDHVLLLWQQRLEALAQAVPAVSGAAILQIASEKSELTVLSRLSSNARLARVAVPGWSTTTKVTVGVVGLGALGGLSYWLFKIGKWPIKSGWPFK